MTIIMRTFLIILFCIVEQVALIQSAPAQSTDSTQSGVKTAAAETSEPTTKAAEPSWLTLGFQQTFVSQGHGTLNVPYSGERSLKSSSELAMTLSATLFASARLWKGGEIVIHPEIAGGAGISGAVGLAGFSNGEAVRAGNPSPALYFARYYLKQSFDLSSSTDDKDASKLSVLAGKFSVGDFFDANAYSHDPRGQFLNWSLMSNGAWDMPADVRGYTLGSVVEYSNATWAARLLGAMVPVEANGAELDTRLANAHGLALELEYHYALGGRSGAVRALAYRNTGRMGRHNELLAAMSQVTPTDDDIIHRYGAVKYGFGLNIEQQINENVGVFMRAGWNDGATESWMFTQIDQTLSAGALINGALWNRRGDNAGLGFAANGISQNHRDFLANGGTGFIVGDGKLTYGAEIVLEAFYKVRIAEWFSLTADYQFVVNPAYNQDRGTVGIAALRGHIEL
jgi:high affinity Mn2+ porin